MSRLKFIPRCRNHWLAGRICREVSRCSLRQPFAVFLIALFLFCYVASAGAATNEAFAHGLDMAKAGHFPEAANVFQTEAAKHPSAGSLINLGIVEWQRGRAGNAILAWERARWIDPFDRRARQNLEFARMAAQVNAPELRWHEQASLWLPPNAWVWLAGVSLWLAVGALTIPRFLRLRKSGWQQWLAAAGSGLFLLALAANAGVVSRTNSGVVLKPNAPLLLTPTSTSEVQSTLAAGEPARKLKTRGGYYFVSTAQGTGWVEQKNIGMVNGE